MTKIKKALEEFAESKWNSKKLTVLIFSYYAISNLQDDIQLYCYTAIALLFIFRKSRLDERKGV